jgi:hypothetical protein
VATPVVLAVVLGALARASKHAAASGPRESPSPTRRITRCSTGAWPADLLDIVLTEQMASDRWDHIRAAAMRGVNRDFSWQVLDAGPRPVIDIGMV